MSYKKGSDPCFTLVWEVVGLIIILLLIGIHSTLANCIDAVEFYQNKVDKKDYEEFFDAKIKVKQLIMVQDLPKVFDEKEWQNYPSVWRYYQKKELILHTQDLNPEHQVYYFISLKDDGQKIYIKHAMYNAKTQQLCSKGFGHWSKEEFRRKFEKNQEGA